MDMAGLASSAGSLFSSALSYRNAQTNRAYQERLSSSAYQRAMADMKKAGLNPILAGRMGGASTPSGSNVNIGNPGLAYAQAQQASASARQMDVNAGIQQTTLDMLEREKVSMAEVQYTAKNIFESKTLKAIESGMAGDLEGLEEPYRSVARYVMVELKKAGALPSTAGMQGTGRHGLHITGETLGKIFSGVAKIIGDSGIQGLTALGASIF